MARRTRTLQQGLDRDVYQIVQKYRDESHDQTLRYQNLYEYISQSNSSLKRRPRKQLEDSIERVIDVIQEDEVVGSDDDIPDVVEDFGSEKFKVTSDRSGDWMNRQIVSRWATKSKATENKSEKNRKREVEEPKERDSKRHRKNVDADVSISQPSGVELEDLGGVDHVIEQLSNHLVLPLKDPRQYYDRQLPLPHGILLHGPPGCGKTVISRAFATAMHVPFIEIQGPSIVSGMSGESEKNIRDHFEKAKQVAPSIIFIDEIDVIAPKRDNSQSQMEKRIVAQLLLSIDGLQCSKVDEKPVIVIAATNRPDDLDPALRRGGRFDDEINMGVPNQAMREKMLKAITRHHNLTPDVDFTVLAKRTAGFVGADLQALVSKVGMWTLEKYRTALEQQAIELESLEEGAIDLSPAASTRRLIRRLEDAAAPQPQGLDTGLTMAAFEVVLPHIVPSSKREGFTTIPDTTWRDVGALGRIREELEMAICRPIEHPEQFAKLGIKVAGGVLLWGPPGCGKTLLAKAVAAESRANLISVKGPELLNKYLGESERALRTVFMRARSSSPCIIFIDEIDAFVPKRSSQIHEASARVVNTLLAELDGINGRDGIYLIAATNRPDMIDEAMLRPGRLEILLYIELPSPEDRVAILKTIIKQGGVLDPSLAEVGRSDKCTKFSGADLKSLLRRASIIALRRNAGTVENSDLHQALDGFKPSVSDVSKYEKMRDRFERTFW